MKTNSNNESTTQQPKKTKVVPATDDKKCITSILTTALFTLEIIFNYNDNGKMLLSVLVIMTCENVTTTLGR